VAFVAESALGRTKPDLARRRDVGNMVAPGLAADVDAALVALQNAACDADEAAAE